MLKVEEKLDRESSLKLEDKKAELKDEMVTIEKYFYFVAEKSEKKKM